MAALFCSWAWSTGMAENGLFFSWTMKYPARNYWTISGCVVGSSTMSRRCTGIQFPYSWCDPGHGTTLLVLWGHPRTTLGAESTRTPGPSAPVAVQSHSSGTGKSLPFAGTSRRTSAAHCGRHPAGQRSGSAAGWRAAAVTYYIWHVLIRNIQKHSLNLQQQTLSNIFGCALAAILENGRHGRQGAVGRWLHIQICL